MLGKCLYLKNWLEGGCQGGCHWAISYQGRSYVVPEGGTLPGAVPLYMELVDPGQVSRGGAAPAEAVEGVQAGVQVQGC